MLSKAALLLFTIVLSTLAISQTKTMNTSVAKAAEFIVAQQREDGMISDSSNQLFNIWETILATDALMNLKPKTYQDEITKALNFLKTNENSNGLICHNTKCIDSVCIETSSLYLELFSREDFSEGTKDKLAKIRSMQKIDGSWDVGNPDVNEHRAFPSVTGFVVNLFNAYSFEDFDRIAALNYIVSKQLSDGSWGQEWEYYGCPGYALWQCMQALEGDANYGEYYQKAKEFILENQHEDGSWFFQNPTIANNTSSELQTALMLQCLLYETDENARKALEKGVAFLLTTQQADGSWNGGYFPILNSRYKKKEYIFATSLIIKTFSLLLIKTEK